MNCQEISHYLPDYFHHQYKDLPQFLQVHIHQCQSCSLEWQGALKVAKIFKLLPVMPVPSELTQQILSLNRELMQSQQKSVGFYQKIKASWLALQEKGLWSPAPAGMLAMFVIALTVTFLPSANHTRTDLADAQLSMPSMPEMTLPATSLRPYAPNSYSFNVQNVSTGDLDLLQGLTDSSPSNQLEGLEKQFEERQRSMMEADADSLMMRGRRFKAMGRMDLALNDFETIVRFYPEYSYLGDVLMYRAQCYAFQGDFDKAINSLSSYADKYPAKKDLVTAMIRQLEQENTAQ